MKKPTYKLENIKLFKNQNLILSFSELEIFPGEVLALLGPSGAGKSSLLKLLHLLEPPTEGSLRFENKQIDYSATIKLRRKIGMVFQRPEFISRNVIENITFPSKLRNQVNQTRIERIIEKLGISNLVNVFPDQLSGGELQRVSIARIFSYQPEVILLDEPTSDLDPRNIKLIEGLVLEAKSPENTIVWVTHNLQQALRVSDRIIIMLDGNIAFNILRQDWDNTKLPTEVARFLEHN